MDKGYYKTKESVDEYTRLAEGYNGLQLIEKLKKLLPKNSSLLEVGSGPGSDFKILDEIYNVTGSDNSIEFLKCLITKYPTSTFLELDAVTLDTNNVYDGIYSNKVLHHLTDEELESSIEKQHKILSPEGIICHSFWKGEGSEVFKGLYVNYHSQLEIKKYFESQFETIFLEDYTEFDENDSILYIGKKK